MLMLAQAPDGIWRDIQYETPRLPIFSLSPRVARKAPAAPKPRHDATPRGPMCSFPERPDGVKIDLGPIEEGWRNLQPYFKTPIKETGMLTPMGSAPAIHEMTFNDRHAELSWIIQTQQKELATETDLLAANGIGSFSLSSSKPSEDDDDIEAGNIAEEVERLGWTETRPGEKFDAEAERDAQRYGVSYSTVDLSPMIRRIEWERYAFACSQATTITAVVRENGYTIKSSNRKWKPRHLDIYAPRFAAAMADAPWQDWENNRVRAAHYKAIVWSLMTPGQQLAWRKRSPKTYAYLNEADDNTSRVNWPIERLLTFVEDRDEEGALITQSTDEVPDPNNIAGPVELHFAEPTGVHSPHSIMAGIPMGHAPTEPTEFDLWPIEEDEYVLPIEVWIKRADSDWHAA